MRINYQIMTENQKNEHGKYIPDWEALIAGATCKEEIEYIKKVQTQNEKWVRVKGWESIAGFAFNMVYVTKQICEHFEIFQSPQNEHYTPESVLAEAEKHTKMKCSKCICGR
jgi:hypothetical protein